MNHFPGLDGACHNQNDSQTVFDENAPVTIWYWWREIRHNADLRSFEINLSQANKPMLNHAGVQVFFEGGD